MITMWPGAACAVFADIYERPFAQVPRDELLAANEALHGRRVRVVSAAPHADEPYEGVFLHFTVEDEDGSYRHGIFYFEVRLYARELRLETRYGSTTHIPVQNIVELTVLGPQLHRCFGCMEWDRRSRLVHEFGEDPVTGEFRRLEDRPLVHAGCEE